MNQSTLRDIHHRVLPVVSGIIDKYRDSANEEDAKKALSLVCITHAIGSAASMKPSVKITENDLEVIVETVQASIHGYFDKKRTELKEAKHAS